MANRKKEVYKPKPMTEGKRNIIQGLLQEYDIATAFPMTEQQRCIVHMVRNTLKYVANKDMKAFAKDLKTIYTSPDEKNALKQIESVTEKWNPLYPHAMNRWKENWDAISPIFKISKGVRTAFYTTNAIESLNASYRHLNRQRSVFSNSQALLKLLYLATFEAKNGLCRLETEVKCGVN